MLEAVEVSKKYWDRSSGRQYDVLQSCSLQIAAGEAVGMMGPSGCGKSTALDVLAGILRPDSGDGSSFLLHTADGETDMLALWRAGRLDALARLRGKHLGYVLQIGGLLPFLSARDNILLPCRCLGNMGRRLEAVWNMATALGIDRLLLQMPASLSVGERQRVAIARSVALEPRFIVADEPVASLDVSIQAQIMALFRHLRQGHDFTFLFIAHDLAMVRYLCDRVGVMRHGRLVELAPTEELFARPLHAYTRALLSAMPVPDPLFEQRKEILPCPDDESDGTWREVHPGHWLRG